MNAAMCVIINLSWRLVLTLTCCTIRFKSEGLEEFRQGITSSSGRPRICIQNHISFIDAVVGVTVFPASAAGDVKMMASNHLFNMPVIGTLAEAMGHLKVPFQTHDTKTDAPPPIDDRSDPLIPKKGSIANFHVDVDEMQKTLVEFEEWVTSGKIGAYFPEGRMNPNPAKLQMFRAGGFTLPTKVDCEIWCLVTLGNDSCWSRKGAVGGKPCKIALKAFRLCESSFALVNEAGGENPNVFLANAAQKRMQAELDKLVAEGWAKTQS